MEDVAVPTSLVEEQIRIDSLPYVDTEYSLPGLSFPFSSFFLNLAHLSLIPPAGMKEYVEKLVAAEMKKMPKKDYLHDRPLRDFKVKVLLLEIPSKREN